MRRTTTFRSSINRSAESPSLAAILLGAQQIQAQDLTTVTLMANVTLAANAVRTASSNVNFSGPNAIDSHDRLLDAVDEIDRDLSHSDDVDTNGIKRLPARLLAAANHLGKVIEKETLDPLLNPNRVADLKQAWHDLMILVPGLNTIKAQLEASVTKAINDSFGLTGANQITFHFAFIKDYDTAITDLQPALIVGLEYDNPTLIDLDETVTKDLDLQLKSGKSVTVADALIDYKLVTGLTVNLAGGITLDTKTPFLLTNASSQVQIPFTELKINAGLSATADGMLGFQPFAAVTASADANLRKATVDGWGGPLPRPIPSGSLPITLPLSLHPEQGADGRFIIVTAITANIGTVLNGAGNDPDYLLIDAGGSFTVQIKRWPGGTAPTQVTVEYLDSSTSGIDNINNQATFDVTLNKLTPVTFVNTIGAVAFTDLNSTMVKISSNGLLNASIDATLLGNKSDDIITLAVSAEHPLQPQADFDEQALGQLFLGVGFNLKTLVAGIDQFLLAVENGLADKLLAKLPIGGKDMASKVQFVKKLREKLVTPFYNFLSGLGSNNLSSSKNSISSWLTNSINTALSESGTPLQVHANVDVETDPEFKFEFTLDIQYKETLNVDFSSGLIGLPIFQVGAEGGVAVDINFDAGFGFGIDQENGFYLLDRHDQFGVPVPELSFVVDAKLKVDNSVAGDPIPTSMIVNLYGLKLERDRHAGPHHARFGDQHRRTSQS